MGLIDADELRKVMYHEAFETDSDMQKWDSGCWIRYKMFEKAIDFVPTIDAVPVVRCKDCKYWNTEHAYCEGFGNWFGMVDEWSENGFCYKGERRTDNGH